MAALGELRYPPQRANDDDELRARMARRGVPQQLLDSGRAFMLVAAALVLTWHHHLAGACSPELALAAAFVVWLLGASLAMLSLVAPQFPRLALAGAALARALRNYLLGGL